MTLQSYTVMADAVMLTTGKDSNGKPEVTRVMYGTEIKAEPTDERIIELLATKAVVKSSSPAVARGAHVTVKMVAKAMLPDGEELDLMNGIEPLSAPQESTGAPAVAPAPEIPLVSAGAPTE
jgi:hypothetical protein